MQIKVVLSVGSEAHAKGVTSLECLEHSTVEQAIREIKIAPTACRIPLTKRLCLVEPHFVLSTPLFTTKHSSKCALLC